FRIAFARGAVGREDTAAERRRAAGDLAPDPAIADNAKGRAAHLAMRFAALHPARSPRRALAEFARNLKKAVMQRQHRHHDVFGDRGLVAKRVADRATLWQRPELE